MLRPAQKRRCDRVRRKAQPIFHEAPIVYARLNDKELAEIEAGAWRAAIMYTRMTRRARIPRSS